MFSKNNVYMFPHGPLSSSHPPNSAANEIFLHHHDMLSGHYSGGGDPFAAANPCASAKASKKDRHSKIYTAQGPRDRRVRLSIGVARKFFDLQESLGFDKPSKTLDWLLTKSKADINDLVEMRGKKGSSDAAASECEVDSAEALDLKNKVVVTNSAEKLKGSAKESRMKARARARERTREKMSIKKLNNINYELNPIQLMNNQLKISGGSNTTNNINLGIREAMLYESAATNDQDLIQESIVIKRKVKHHPSSILGFQQNLIISSSNYGVVPSPYTAAAENWDISTILDQHKFMNGNSNN